MTAPDPFAADGDEGEEPLPAEGYGAVDFDPYPADAIATLNRTLADREEWAKLKLLLGRAIKLISQSKTELIGTAMKAVDEDAYIETMEELAYWKTRMHDWAQIIDKAHIRMLIAGAAALFASDKTTRH